MGVGAAPRIAMGDLLDAPVCRVGLVLLSPVGWSGSARDALRHAAATMAVGARALAARGAAVWLCAPDGVLAVHPRLDRALLAALDVACPDDRGHVALTACVGHGEVIGGEGLGAYGAEARVLRRLGALQLEPVTCTEGARQALGEVPAGVGLHRGRVDVERWLGAPWFVAADYRQ